MYAVIQTGGKQYRVQPGDVIYVELLAAQADDTIVFEDVLAVGAEGKVVIGTPSVEGARVTGVLLKNGKGKKLNIITYKPKKGSVRRVGHRQPYSKVEITEILGKGGKAVTEKAPAKEEPAPEAPAKKAAPKKPAEKPATAKKPAAKKPAAKKEEDSTEGGK